MGLFSKIVKKGLDSLLNPKNNDGFTKTFGNEDTQKLSEAKNEPVKNDVPMVGKFRNYSVSDKFHNKFSNIINSNFSNYIIKENIVAPVLGIASETPVKKYSFIICEGNDIKALVMLVPHNRQNNRIYSNAREAAANAGIPYMDFYDHFPNETDYVVQRISAYL